MSMDILIEEIKPVGFELCDCENRQNKHYVLTFSQMRQSRLVSGDKIERLFNLKVTYKPPFLTSKLKLKAVLFENDGFEFREMPLLIALFVLAGV